MKPEDIAEEITLATITISVLDVMQVANNAMSIDEIREWFAKNQAGILDEIWGHISDVLQAYKEED